MLFNSFDFAVFFPIVFLLYWIFPHKFRWILLLISSYYFYMSWNIKCVFLILFTTIISYCAAMLIEKHKSKRTKKWIMVGAAILCLGVLVFFKYFNFLAEFVGWGMNLFAIDMNPITLNLLLPVGISFYTFQTLSYVIDVYKGKISAEKHFGYYATFISFFPQLVAGPIERTHNLLPQIKAKHNFDYEQVSYGLKLMTWGYFKKMVIADTLSLYVSKVYNMPQNFQGFALVLATVFFAVQIYCDFSGYSDIAIGTAKMLGIKLMSNFKSPYFSQSIKELWGRWNISLSSWFQDYVYIPLGGSRVGKVRHSFNLMITFLASGLWHGANWTFIVWGGVQGMAQIFESKFLPKNKPKNTGIVGWLRIFIVFVFFTFTLIIFVSNSIGDAAYVTRHLFNGISNPIRYLYDGFSNIGMSKGRLALELLFIIILAIYDFLSLKIDVLKELSKKKLVVRWFVYVCIGLIIIFFSQKGVEAEFVYFQF